MQSGEEFFICMDEELQISKSADEGLSSSDCVSKCSLIRKDFPNNSWILHSLKSLFHHGCYSTCLAGCYVLFGLIKINIKYIAHQHTSIFHIIHHHHCLIYTLSLVCLAHDYVHTCVYSYIIQGEMGDLESIHQSTPALSY